MSCAAATRTTSPRRGSSAGSSCGTWVAPASRGRRSPPSTSRCGICARGCTASRSTTLLAGRARPRAGLRQRRLLLVLARPAARAARRLGRRRHPAREDEARPRAGRGPGTPRRGTRGDRGRPSSTSTRTARSPRRRRSAGQRSTSTRGTCAWFEEPVSSADFDGLRLVRESSLLDVAAGEYAYVPADFRNLIGKRRLPAGRRHTLRRRSPACCASTGWQPHTGRRVGSLRAAALGARAVRRRPAPPSRVLPRPRAHRVDAVRRRARAGRRRARPDRSRPGHGLELKRAEAQRYAA